MSTRLKEKPRDSFNLNIVRLRLESLHQIWEECRANHADIIIAEDDEVDVYVASGVFSRLQVLYKEISDFLMVLLAELEQANDAAMATRRSFDFSYENGELTANLPKLNLPRFSGEYSDWENFRDLFTTLVHDRARLSNATKLQYLKTCLTGAAADLVKDVPTTDANYESTWQTLNDRFHNPRLIVYNHLQKLKEIPHLKKESAVDLRSFTDEALRIYRALKNLKMPVEHWDVWLVFTLSSRLDPDSRKAWETELNEKDRSVSFETNLAPSSCSSRFPKFEDFSQFLEKRTRTLGMLSSDNKTTSKATASSKPVLGPKRTFHAAFGGNENSKCLLCMGNHPLRKCLKFQAKTPFERREEARRLKICFNCLGNHKFNDCKSQGRCFTCQSKHHTLLHYDSTRSKAKQSSFTETPKSDGGNSKEPVNVHTASISSFKQISVLLPTAQFTVIGPNVNQTRVRALLDQGSETSFVSDKIAQLLSLPKNPVNVPLSGLGAQDVGMAHFSTHFTLQSLVDPSFKLETNALILQRLTSHLPSRRLLDIKLESLSGLQLADPQFHTPDSIDVLLGADVYGQLLLSGLRRFPPSSLLAQKTVLGWIVSGPVPSGRAAARSRSPVTALHCTVHTELNESLLRFWQFDESMPQRSGTHSQLPVKVVHCAIETDLNECLQRFWNLEELPSAKNVLSPDESSCDELFKNTHTRDSTGRYIVRLPLKSRPPAVAVETRRMALGSLNHVHQRFARDSKYAQAYREFMLKYESLGHMERVPANEIHNGRAWYLPHHAVVQSSPSTWKMRVVFDASRQTRDKVCLNDFLLPGPALQRDLALTLLNWRRYRFVFTVDIVKMFRQIRVSKDHQDLQRILWSPISDRPPIDYRLSTVTYGTSCAPYLAIRTLLQLAQDGKSRFPLGAHCLESNTYVDDIFTGADDLDCARQIRGELVELLNSAGIDLDKWAVNHSDLLPSRSSNSEDSKSIDLDESVKTLGIRWNPLQDEFGFTTLGFEELAGASTKRAVLSTISRLFDHLGWLAPITVTAKILIQNLWIAKCDWDDSLPIDIRQQWLEYCQSLTSLPSLSIGRWFGTYSGTTAQIHGFSDASSRAYAAAVYLRIDDGNGSFRVSLLAAKTKVAPVKTVSIRNLELCGATLLVKLIRHLQTLEFLQRFPIYARSDSQIVLQWLKRHPCHWKTFIANRVSFIQTELPSAVWSHVPTKENPADLATRGTKPTELAESRLWWCGPDWLALSAEHWPQRVEPLQILHTRSEPGELDFFSRISSLDRLIGVVAYCVRPIAILRRRRMNLDSLPDFLTLPELNKAQVVIIRLVQSNAFPREIELLKAGKSLPKLNALLKLNPFVDKEDGLLRIGGRLAHSDLSYQRKHPPILPRSSAVSRLFVRQAHRDCLHGGPTLTSSILTQRVWLLGRNRLVKTEIRNCVSCQRAHPRLAHQMMGDLPATRTTPARPFSSTGVDYAGPIELLVSKGRGYKTYKGYLVIFVCFCTRAIHLEVVEDLQAVTFVSAYRRFAGRRGVCQNLYSDNATTFQGADRELQAMFNAAATFYQTAAASLARDGTNWIFIPPNSPHYGGLWEAGVKSVKNHLKRAVGDRKFTFAELSTILVEIEACLNSRPLSPLSSDIEDFHALTPSHFLIGGASGLIPDEEPPEVPENRLSRPHLLQAVRNQFWKRWSREYLQHLQERAKWRSPEVNFAVGATRSS